MERNTEHGRETGSPSIGQGAGRGLSYLLELEPDIRAAAVVDGDGVVIECTDPGPSVFGVAAAGLVEVVDGSGGKPFDSCHIASAEAEVFMVREGDLSLIAVTERFVLASLMAFDMRMTLRDLSGGRKFA